MNCPLFKYKILSCYRWCWMKRGKKGCKKTEALAFIHGVVLAKFSNIECFVNYRAAVHYSVLERAERMSALWAAHPLSPMRERGESPSITPR